MTPLTIITWATEKGSNEGKLWLLITEYKRVLIQPGDGRRSTGHKINSQLECTINRKILSSLRMFKMLIPPQTDGVIRSSFNIGCSESKVIFKWRKTTITTTTTKRMKRLYRPLQGAKVRTSCIWQTKDSRHGQSTHRKARREPAIRDAQNLAQNVFPPWRVKIKQG